MSCGMIEFGFGCLLMSMAVLVLVYAAWFAKEGVWGKK